MAFNRPIDLPLKAQSDNANNFDPEYKDGVSYHLAYDSEIDMLRVEVPKHRISQATGVGVLTAGSPVKLVYGHEPVQWVPREMISRISFVEEQQDKKK